MGLLTILFLVSIIIGSKDTSGKEQTEQKEENEDMNMDEVHQYRSPNGGFNEIKEKDTERYGRANPPREGMKEMENGEIWEDHEGIGEIIEQEIDESKLPSSYEELYGERDVKESKKIVKAFVEIIHNVNGDEPMKYIEESKDYMTDDLYKSLLEDYKQGQMAWTYGLKRNYKSLEIYEPATTRVNDGIVWAANVQGTIQYDDNKKREKTDIYLIHLKKIDGEYKVDDYFVNVPT